jgi:hypothetical protein
MKIQWRRALVLVSLGLIWSLALPLRATADNPEKCKKSTFPASGQTTAYTADKYGNPDAVVPDDGTVQAGATLRYRDMGNGTIEDENARLIWEKKSDDGGLHDKDRAYPWSSVSTDTIWDWLDAVNAEGGTGFAGYND